MRALSGLFYLGEGWISLDFLGFSRPNRDFSMGYTGFSRKNISRPFSAASRGAGTVACGRGHAEGQDWPWGSLPRFLIFCKRLPSEPFPFGRFNPKATRSRADCNSVESDFADAIVDRVAALRSAATIDCVDPNAICSNQGEDAGLGRRQVARYARQNEPESANGFRAGAGESR